MSGERRRDFRNRLSRPGAVLAPVCLDPLTARLCEELGFEAGYLSGGSLGYALAISEALLTTSEIVDASTAIGRRSGLPLIVDIGTGFGDALHTWRTINDVERSGAIAVELEDQQSPKRVAHHRGVEVFVSTDEMCRKLDAAASARTDPNLIIIARTGTLRHFGLEHAAARGRAYLAAGADVLLLSGMTEEDRQAAPEAVGARIATFASLDALPAASWWDLGYCLVIDPITGQSIVVEALRDTYQRQLRNEPPTHTPSQVFELYTDLARLAGLDELYAIEDPDYGGGS